MARSCMFCGAPAGSREHVWPDWLSRVLGSEAATHVVSANEVPERRWTKAPFTTTSKRVCHECNTGWMSRLESVCKPVLIPLLRGEAYRLNTDRQRLVAAWSLKTAAMLDSTLGGSLTVDGTHLRTLMERQEPPATVRVVLAAYPGIASVANFYRAGVAQIDATSPEAGSEVGQFYGMTLALGKLLIQVSGHTLKRHRLDVHSDALGEFLIPVWPASPDEAGGPPPPMPEHGFDVLAQAFRGGPTPST